MDIKTNKEGLMKRADEALNGGMDRATAEKGQEKALGDEGLIQEIEPISRNEAAKLQYAEELLAQGLSQAATGRVLNIPINDVPSTAKQ